MKKVLTLMAVFAMVGFVSCKKDPEPAPKPEEKPVTATITAGDVTVEEGATANINATTNSTATISYTSADASVASVSAAGVVTGVKAGSTTITLKVDAVEGKFTAAEKTINVTVSAKEEPPVSVAGITIDGDFSDWTELEAGTFAKSVSDPDAPWEGVEEIRCYASEETVYYYIKFNAEELADAFTMEPNDMHLRLCINTDGEFGSGYTSYFLEGYDFIIEGTFADGGEFVDFDGEFHQRYGENGPSDSSTKWHSLLGPENGLVAGKGAGNEYEISLSRTKFNEAANTSDFPLPMGDEFQTGIRFYYNGWQEFSNVPNSSLEEEDGSGYGYLMRVKFNK